MENKLFYIFSIFFAFLALVGCRKDFSDVTTDSSHFIRFYGDSYPQVGEQVIESPTGELYIVGTNTPITGASSILLVKTQSNGEQIWKKEYLSLDSNKNCEGASIQFTPDGQLIILGTETKFEQDSSSAMLLKVDTDGNELWRQQHFIYDDLDPNNGFNHGSYVHSLSDGTGYLIMGYKSLFFEDEHKVFVARTDLEGMIDDVDGNTWSDMRDDRSSFESVSKVIEVGNVYAFVGATDRLPLADISQAGVNGTVFLYSRFGTKLDQRTYGGTGDDFAYDLIANGNGSFLVLGSTQSSEHKLTTSSTDKDVFVVEIQIDDVSPSNPIDGVYHVFGGERDDEGYSFVLNLDKTISIAGMTESVDTELKQNIMLMKLNEDLSDSWGGFKNWGGDFDDRANSIIQSSDGGYIFAGTSGVDQNEMIGLIKTTTNGELK